jgi:hypothetical protein
MRDYDEALEEAQEMKAATEKQRAARRVAKARKR